METKSTKDFLKELQEMADKHSSLKKEVEYLVLEGEKIEDKLQDAERLFSISESIETIINEMDAIEIQYEKKLEEYKKSK